MTQYVLRNTDGEFIFGNRSTTTEFKYARRFDSKTEVDDHIKSWGLKFLAVESSVANEDYQNLLR